MHRTTTKLHSTQRTSGKEPGSPSPRLISVKKLCGTLFLLSTTVLPVASQDIYRDQFIDKVTVSSNPLRSLPAASMVTMDSLQLSETAYATFAELLARHSTVYIKSYGSGSLATASFRGTSATHTRVEWNGLEINGPLMGQVDFSQIPVWLTDRIDIYNGGSSLREGYGALGGLISIHSAPQWDKCIYGDVGQSFGSFSSYQGFATLGGGTDKVQVKVRYFYDMADNDFKYRNLAVRPVTQQRLKNARYVKHGGTVDIFTRAARDNFFSFNMWFHHSDRNLPADMLYEGANRKETQLDREVRGVVNWTKYLERGRSELILGFSYADLNYRFKIPSSYDNPVQSASDSKTDSYQYRYNFNYNILKNTELKVRLDGKYETAYVKDIKNNKNNYNDRFQTGLSVGVDQRILNTLTGFILLREELSAGDLSPFMPSAGLEYRPLGSNILVIKSTVSRVYRTPTLSELYWQPGGNPELDPEKGTTFDATVSTTGTKGNFGYSLSVTGYGSWINDWILWRPRNDNAGYRFSMPENVAKVRARGVEVYSSLEYRWPEVTVSLGGVYSYTRSTDESENISAKGVQLPYVPEHKANVMFTTSYKGWYVYWLWSCVGERLTSSSDELKKYALPAYDLHDVTLGKNINIFNTVVNAEVKANNIFGRRYRSLLWRPMPRQNYSAVIKISF